MFSRLFLVAAISIPAIAPAQTTDLGNLSNNPYDPDSTSNPYGAGNPYDPNSINNPYGRYGSPYGTESATNPYATDAPKLYDQNGNYRGKLSSNPYDPESISNPYGRYGNPHSPDSINNPYGAGNRYGQDSPNNPYSEGWKIIGQDEDSSGPANSYSTGEQEQTDHWNTDGSLLNSPYSTDDSFSSDDPYDLNSIYEDFGTDNGYTIEPGDNYDYWDQE